jgi:F420-non-reducing hydrogenase iron-sulfur subunit
LATAFEPKIVGFLCRWCSYAGADLAGTNRMKYPSNVSAIRVNCSGRIDPTLVLKALSLGADGVLIAGCHPGDCHYTNGNIKTLRRFKLLQKMLDQYGIERKRVRLEWVSAAEGEKYAQVVRTMTDEVQSLGPLNWKTKVELAA